MEIFKDTVFPTRVLRRELTVVTEQLKQMEQEMERMRGGVHHNALSVSDLVQMCWDMFSTLVIWCFFQILFDVSENRYLKG